MKVTYNWLKDFVEIRISPQELAEKLTMAGLEVTSLEEKDTDQKWKNASFCCGTFRFRFRKGYLKAETFGFHS